VTEPASRLLRPRPVTGLEGWRGRRSSRSPAAAAPQPGCRPPVGGVPRSGRPYRDGSRGTRAVCFLRLQPLEEGRYRPRRQAGAGQEGDATAISGPLLVAAIREAVELARLGGEAGQVATAEHQRDQRPAAEPADQLPQRVAVQHVADLVGQDAGHLLGRAGLGEQPRIDDDLAPRQGGGIDQIAVHDRDLEGVAGVGLDRRLQPLHDRGHGGRCGAGVDRLLAGQQLRCGRLADQPLAGRRNRRGDQIRGQPREEQPAGSPQQGGHEQAGGEAPPPAAGVPPPRRFMARQGVAGRSGRVRGQGRDRGGVAEGQPGDLGIPVGRGDEDPVVILAAGFAGEARVGPANGRPVAGFDQDAARFKLHMARPRAGAGGQETDGLEAVGHRPVARRGISRGSAGGD
jgi:hypothetical protein